MDGQPPAIVSAHPSATWRPADRPMAACARGHL